jgi:hypothetical protein
MSDRWYYAKDRKKHGPLAKQEIRLLLASGQLYPADMILKEGDTRWVPASSLLPPPPPP